MNRAFIPIVYALSLATIITGCTGTDTEIRSRAPLSAHGGSALRGQSTAVLPFIGPNGPEARDAVIRAAAEQEGARIVSPSKINAYLAATRAEPSAYDPAALSTMAREFGASRLIWGQVNQFTPYHFNRLVPATPAYAEITLNIWFVEDQQTRSLLANKQAAIPFTIWDRQPTFADIAGAAAADTLASLH